MSICMHSSQLSDSDTSMLLDMWRLERGLVAKQTRGKEKGSRGCKCFIRSWNRNHELSHLAPCCKAISMVVVIQPWSSSSFSSLSRSSSSSSSPPSPSSHPIQLLVLDAGYPMIQILCMTWLRYWDQKLGFRFTALDAGFRA